MYKGHIKIVKEILFMRTTNKVISTFIVFTMLFLVISLPVSAYEKITNAYTIETDIYDEDFKVVGKKISIVTTETTENPDSKVTLINENSHYKFYTQQERFTALFKNESSSNKIEIKNNGEYYINGERISDVFLSTPVNFAFTPRSIEEGGRANFTHYTNMGRPPLDYFKCFARETSNNMFMDSPRGGEITKWLYSGSDLSDFKMYANNVANARSTINGASAALVASGITNLTPAFVLGLIGTSASAFAIWQAGKDGDAAMLNAYNLLKRADGYEPSN